MLGRRGLDGALDFHQLLVGCLQLDLLIRYCRADVAGNVQVVAFLGDALHGDALGVAVLFRPVAVGVDDLVDVRLRESVLAFAFLEVLGGVDEEHVVRLLALLEHQDADRDACGVEEIRGQADDGVDVAVFEQLGADALLRTATKEHAVGQDDGHHAFFFQEVKAVQEEGEIGGGLWREAVIFEPHVVAHRIRRVPAVAERRICDDGVEVGLLGGVQLLQHFPIVEQRVAVEDLELRVLHPMQQHVHAGEVVGGDVLFLPEDFANAVWPHLLPHVEQQRAGAAGKIEHLVQLRLLASLRLLTGQLVEIAGCPTVNLQKLSRQRFGHFHWHSITDLCSD